MYRSEPETKVKNDMDERFKGLDPELVQDIQSNILD